ncbi:DUF1129 family protein [Streptococcaceae bacterium ESL0687]|nr:DUF1129 family protein [Streptococcaceae bacterium ESL0687]
MEEYFDKLSAKNKDYLITVSRQLSENGKSKDQIDEIFKEHIDEIISHQERGIPARNFLGTPSAFAGQFIEKNDQGAKTESKTVNTNKYLMWLDNFLLLLGVLAAVNGGVGLFSKNPQTYGIITLLIMSAGAGLIMSLMYNNFSKKDEQKSGGRFKSFAFMTLAMFAWIAVFVLASLLPQAINPTPSPLVTLIIGLVALVVRYFVKKHYNIQSSMTNYQSK